MVLHLPPFLEECNVPVVVNINDHSVTTPLLVPVPFPFSVFMIPFPPTFPSLNSELSGLMKCNSSGVITVTGNGGGGEGEESERSWN